MPDHPLKLAFIDVKYTKPIVLPKGFLEKLPRRVALFTTIQFHDQYEKLKGQLKAAGKEVVVLRPKHAWHDGQLLGCGVEDWSKERVDAFVYVGDGLFHPKAILFQNTAPVHLYDPKTGDERTITQEELRPLLKRRKGALTTFHTAKRVGVLITTKYGQERLTRSFALETQYPGKEFYYFLDDTLNLHGLEDFPFIEVYVNTACPRMMDDHEKLVRPVLNIADITENAW